MMVQCLFSAQVNFKMQSALVHRPAKEEPNISFIHSVDGFPPKTIPKNYLIDTYRAEKEGERLQSPEQELHFGLI